MAKRMNDTEERKKEILDAAEKRFLQHGFYHVNVDDIAEDAGVVRGTVLHYFGTKEKLFQAVLVRTTENVLPGLEALIDNEEFSVDRIMGTLLTICNVEFSRGKSVMNPYLPEKDRMYYYDMLHLKTCYMLADCFERLIERGNREGVFHIRNPKARASGAAFAIFGVAKLELSASEMMYELYHIVEKFLFASA